MRAERMMLKNFKENIVIIDFGSQYTHLITKKVRGLGVYSEIVSPETKINEIVSLKPKGIILSGGPCSVYEEDALFPHKEIFKLGIPVLGICYGFQLIVKMFGGRVARGVLGEFGRNEIKVVQKSLLFDSIPKKSIVWMSHGDYVDKVPAGFNGTSMSENSFIASIEKDNIFGIQFHPEVDHTEFGKEMISNFLFKICKVSPSWSISGFAVAKINEIRETAKDGKVISGLSGGVDSSVATILVSKALGKNLIPVFVDTGLLRKNEAIELSNVFRRDLGLKVQFVDAKKQFLDNLKGVSLPEKKRKIIGREFIKVFEKIAKDEGDIKYLVQGTLYPDVIESKKGGKYSAKIKSHHNVGGLPKNMKFILIEPLRELFKDEVRVLGKELGIPEKILARHPFPGPGLAIRIIGEVTEERLNILREADYILLEELRKAGLYDKVWQAFCVFLPVKTVGVMGDKRTYDSVIVIRIVQSSDGMTADWAKVPFDFLKKVSSRIINEVAGVNRVTYDISSKPPATIEWE